RRSPARCHCAANPEGCFCYPLRRASPVVPTWCGGDRAAHPCRAGACPRRRSCVVSSMFLVGAAFGRPWAYNMHRPVIPRPRRGRGNPLSFIEATDCHVGPVALLAMTDHRTAPPQAVTDEGAACPATAKN